MFRFNKKPITIHARQITQPMTVETLEGTMRGEPGSWLIEGIKGEFYFCQDDVFRLTYIAADKYSKAYMGEESDKLKNVEEVEDA